MALRALALFDGYAGFELGLKLALGPAALRTVARVERDAHAAATLMARMEEATLDDCPIWDDITTFDGRPWRGRVDLITAGFNCQPFSSAGQRRGVDDERWLWGDIARVIADVGPRFVFLENVAGLVRGGLPYICADLASLGFDAEWGCLSAAQVGASHTRNRFWLLAWGADGESVGLMDTGGSDRDGGADPVRSCGDVGHAGGPRRSEVTRSTPSDEATDGWRADQSDVVDGASEDVGDAYGTRRPLSGHQGSRSALTGEPDPRCTVVWPPLPEDDRGWRKWIADGGPEPQIRRGADGRPVGLAESLHLGGNGLVPRVAAEAFAALAVRAGIGAVRGVES